MLTDSLKSQIREHHAANPTEENCGIIAEGHAVPCKNLASDPSQDFVLVLPGGVQPDAIWHSHCTDTQPGELTFTDIERCKFNRNALPYLLHRPEFDEHTPECWDYYDPKSPNPFPLTNTKNPNTLDFYLGWRFIWGRSDCFALVRSYFLGMLSIDIGDFKRPDRTARRTFPQPEYVAPWKAEENGFVRVPRGEVVRTNDVVEIAQYGGVNANHIAVITDDVAMMMLHNPDKKNVSTTEMYTDYWQSRTVSHFRHRNYSGGSGI